MYFPRFQFQLGSPLILVTAPGLCRGLLSFLYSYCQCRVLGSRSLLVVCFTSTKSPRGPPWNEGHRPKVRHETSVLEVPAQEQHEHRFTLVLLIHLLQVLCTRHAGIAHHRALQTSGRGWADSKAVHGMECSGARLLYWRSLSAGAAACSVLYCQYKEVCSPSRLNAKQANELGTKNLRSFTLVVYIAGDTLRHQPVGAGHMTVLQLHGPMAFRVLHWCHPMLASKKGTSCCTWIITLYGTQKWIQAHAKKTTHFEWIYSTELLGSSRCRIQTQR